MTDHAAPAFYARRGSGLADWWTLLHPPYTLWHLSYVVLGAAIARTRDWAALGLSVLAFFLAAWHLSYVVIGGCLAPVVAWGRLGAVVLAFGLAGGVCAHALDELRGRPLQTGIRTSTLWVVAWLALAAAVVLGIIGAFLWNGPNWALAAAVPAGATLVVGYNLELFDGRLHNDHAFAWGWGGFPVVVGYLAQSPRPTLTNLAAAVLATLAAVSTSYAQRALSTPARRLRRHTASVSGSLTRADGTVLPLDQATLLAPLERGLRALSYAAPLIATAVWLAGAGRVQ